MNAIVDEVALRGGVTFAAFMELALYHPTAGYYTRRRRGPTPAGPRGDFVTAPTASPLFAATLARVLERLAATLGEPLTLVELAAGDGAFQAGVFGALGEARTGTLCRTVAVEASEWARRRMARRVPGVEVAARLADCTRPTGPVVVFASELYDAIPCHRVAMRRFAGHLELAEFWVVPAPGRRLRWELRPALDPTLERYLAEHGIVLAEGQVAEVRPQVRRLHAETLAWCGHDGVALIVDYGHPARRLYDPRGRARGSLVGYRRHRLVRDVLASPGRCDVTAHVNFDDLQAGAADALWERGEIYTLASFLARSGALDLLPPAVAAGEPLTAAEWAALAAAKRLLVPSGMGVDLKVLEHGRGRVWQALRALQNPPPAEA